MTEAAANIPDAVAGAVDALVSRHGVEGAEAELQERFKSGGDQERVAAAISYLRREYAEVGQ
jgi:ABC-type thiamine transport system ATPase subunit